MSGAPGRLPCGPPIAIIDIGSNSVRLVVYEGLSRAPTALFNEKELCALGRSIATTGRLAEESTARALAALRRFMIELGLHRGSPHRPCIASALTC
ncbi:exopolyphosphatase, partial [Hansschlegelia beijingensis]